MRGLHCFLVACCAAMLAMLTVSVVLVACTQGGAHAHEGSDAVSARQDMIVE